MTKTAMASSQFSLAFGCRRSIVGSVVFQPDLLWLGSISWVSSGAAVKAKLNFPRRSTKFSGSHGALVSLPLCRLSPIKSGMLDYPFCAEEVTRTLTSTTGVPHEPMALMNRFIMLVDLDPATAKAAIGILGPLLSAFSFLFILRIIMSWYPKLPVGKFPYVIAYAPTEPILIPTRKLISPVGGVDVTPVVWFGLLSFLNEILLGPQGLLVLLSQQVS